VPDPRGISLFPDECVPLSGAQSFSLPPRQSVLAKPVKCRDVRDDTRIYACHSTGIFRQLCLTQFAPHAASVVQTFRPGADTGHLTNGFRYSMEPPQIDEIPTS
jgi:hypothetical protein